MPSRRSSSASYRAAELSIGSLIAPKKESNQGENNDLSDQLIFLAHGGHRVLPARRGSFMDLLREISTAAAAIAMQATRTPSAM